MAFTAEQQATVIEHAGESQSNSVRQRVVQSEPKSQRTFTPSLAVLDRSAGSYHWTPEGRKLADFTSGVLVANLGHNPTRWWQNVLERMRLDQLSSDMPYTPAVGLTAYNATTPLEVEACEALLANMRAQPGGARMEQVLWAASGSEAIQKALWAAMKAKPGADQIIATRHGFHGKKGLAGAITGSEADPERDPRVHFVSFPMQECMDIDLRRQPLDLTRYEQELDQLAQQFGDRLCCLVTEPYLGGGGSFHPQREYLQLLESFCRQHDIALILDEIQSNFGRTGPMYAFTHYRIEPDLVCLGKGLGNGVPVSATVGRRDLLAALSYGEASDTWSANPLAAAAVLATLDEFEREDALVRGMALSEVLERGLTRLKQTGVVEHVRGEGCVWGLQCRGVGDHSPEAVANACVEACYLGDTRGCSIHLLGPLAGKVLRVSPPLVMPPGEAEDYLDAMFEIFTMVNRSLAS